MSAMKSFACIFLSVQACVAFMPQHASLSSMIKTQYLHRGINEKSLDRHNGLERLHSSSSPSNSVADDFIDKGKNIVDIGSNVAKNFDIETFGEGISKAVQSAQDNINGENFGSRGELFLLLQLSTLLGILLGDIPILGSLIYVIGGPGLLLTGVSVILIALSELGDQLTPWATPPKNNTLNTSGLYAISRHPMYLGLILSSVGLSVATDSVDRLALSGLLYFILDTKASKEEEELSKVHQDYESYMESVPKIFPKL